jgi:hypothetical protein
VLIQGVNERAGATMEDRHNRGRLFIQNEDGTVSPKHATHLVLAANFDVARSTAYFPGKTTAYDVEGCWGLTLSSGQPEFCATCERKIALDEDNLLRTGVNFSPCGDTRGRFSYEEQFCVYSEKYTRKPGSNAFCKRIERRDGTYELDEEDLTNYDVVSSSPCGRTCFVCGLSDRSNHRGPACTLCVCR